MDIKEAILKRRSIRKFKDTLVDDIIIDELLQSAMAAPSACNKRPWVFYVIKDSETLDKLRLSSRYTNHISPLNIIVCANTKKSLNNRPNDFWIQDCSAAIENILLRALEFNLGSCWCGLFPMVTPVKRVREILSLEEHIIPLALIHIGYPDEVLEPRTQYDKKNIHII